MLRTGWAVAAGLPIRRPFRGRARRADNAVTWPTWPVTVRARRTVCGPSLHRYKAVTWLAHPIGCSHGSLGQQHPRVADVVRIEPLLDRAQHVDAERPDLAFQPGPVVGAHGVVVGQRAARGDHGLGG